jgi:hypothetical protein
LLGLTISGSISSVGTRVGRLLLLLLLWGIATGLLAVRVGGITLLRRWLAVTTSTI